MGLVIPEELAHVARPQTRRPVAAADQRWKREECAYVKHDKLFSDWKVRDVESSLSLSLLSSILPKKSSSAGGWIFVCKVFTQLREFTVVDQHC